MTFPSDPLMCFRFVTFFFSAVLLTIFDLEVRVELRRDLEFEGYDKILSVRSSKDFQLSVLV